MPKSRKSRQTSLFDIRIKSAEQNVIVLKGPEHDASSALLSGVIVLSVLEPISIKKLNLKLYATLRLNWTEYFQGIKSQVARPMKYEKRVYEFNWDPLNVLDYCRNLNDNQAQLPGLMSGQETLNRSNNSSNTSLKSLPKQTKSSANLSQSFASFTNLTHSSQDNKDSNVLSQGNYEFPFSTILPGSIPESVEGLPGCSMVYKLQATIERGRFSQPLVTKKHIRVVRTLTSDAVELSETIAVDNTWPKKVDYSISSPNRAVAIGSTTRVDMLLVPLLKGLKLGNIKVSLVEYYTYCGHVGGHTDERTVFEKIIKKPKGPEGQDIWEDMDIGLDGNFYNDGEIELSPDRWSVSTFIQIPPSLALCTQDCDVLSNVKVRHKLKFVIGLVNPDGHVSELRATLPIIAFISPFVALSAKRPENLPDDHLSVEDVSLDQENDGDDVLFSVDPESVSAPTMATGTSADTHDLMAPPNYENRVYDRLWSGVASPLDSPLHSGLSTPGVVGSGESTPYGGSFPNVALVTPQRSSNALNSSQLVENLRQLHLQREGNPQSMDDLALSSPLALTRARPTFTMAEDNDEPDYFSFKTQDKTVGPSMTTGQLLAQTPGIPGIEGLLSPGASSPLHQHLSRSNSQSDLDATMNTQVDPDASNTNLWDEDVLSRVPSYLTAMKAQSNDDFTPLYEPPLPGSSIDLLLLNKRLLSSKESMASGNGNKSNKGYSRKSYSSYGADNNPVTFDLARSRGSSANSSPAVSRNQSASNLFGFNMSNSNSATKLTKQLTQQSTSSSKNPSRHGSAVNNASLLTSMTPLPTQPPQQAHVHTSGTPLAMPQPTRSQSTMTPHKSVVNMSLAGQDAHKPSRSPSFLGLLKKSHSSVNLHFLNKKKT